MYIIRTNGMLIEGIKKRKGESEPACHARTGARQAGTVTGLTMAEEKRQKRKLRRQE